MVKYFPLTLAALLSVLTFAEAAKPDEKEESRGRVVCFGDSITKRGYPALLGKALGVEAINAGVVGHSSAAGLRRMQKDVVDREPDVVVVFFGTNDARVDSERVHVPVKDYERNLKRMVEECGSAGAKDVICTLPPINKTAFLTRHPEEVYAKAGGLDKLWAQYRQAALRVAKSERVAIVDLNQLLLKTPEWLGKDGVHPSERGSVIIAGLIAAEVAPLMGERE